MQRLIDREDRKRASNVLHWANDRAMRQSVSRSTLFRRKLMCFAYFSFQL